MQAFALLDYDEQVTRLTEAAELAMRGYGYPDAKIRLVMYVNNAVFEVRDGKDRHFALRLHRPGHKSAAWIESELEWLSAIRRDTPLCVPQPVGHLGGDFLLQPPVDGMDKRIIASLLTWVDGEFDEPGSVSPERVRAAGEFLARLHNYSATFTPEPGFTRPRLDKNGLFGEESAYNPGEAAAIFTDEQQAIFNEVERQVRRVMHAMGRNRECFGMIHADFIMKNILFRGEEVCAIDFDDCSWGYYLYDLAPLLLQFKDEPRYPELREALLSGYQQHRPAAAVQLSFLETFIAARLMLSCWWLAGNLHNPRIRERAPELIAHRTAELRRFLDTGYISQQGDTF